MSAVNGVCEIEFTQWLKSNRIINGHSIFL